MVKSFTSEVAGKLKAEIAASKKSNKRAAGNRLSQLFPARQTRAYKLTNAAFKKILEPKQAVSESSSAQPQAAKEKKVNVFNQLQPVAAIMWPAQAFAAKHAETDAKSLPAKKISKEHKPSNIMSVRSPNIRPAINTRSPAHDAVFEPQNTDKSLIADEPKAKENGVQTKHSNAYKTQIESNIPSDKHSLKNVLKKTQSLPSESGFSQTLASKELSTQSPAPSFTATVRPNVPLSREGARGSHRIPVSNGNFKASGEIISKHNKAGYVQKDFIYHKEMHRVASKEVAVTSQIREKTVKMSVPEQFSLGTVNSPAKPEALTGNSFAVNTKPTFDPYLNVADQTALGIKNASDKIGQKIIVNLDPPELGRINIKFEKSGDEINGRLEVEKPYTKSQIELNLSHIVQSLQDSGVQLGRFEVVLRDQSGDGLHEFGGQTQPDWSQKHEFGADRDKLETHSVAGGNTQHLQSVETNTFLSGKSVNILA